MLLWRLVTWLNYFTWKTMSFAYINEQQQQKISKEVKRQGLKDWKKDWKQSEKIILIKIKKRGYFIWSWCILHSAGHILGLSCMR